MRSAPAISRTQLVTPEWGPRAGLPALEPQKDSDLDRIDFIALRIRPGEGHLEIPRELVGAICSKIDAHMGRGAIVTSLQSQYGGREDLSSIVQKVMRESDRFPSTRQCENR
ncbi:MAG: hypothetical protein KDD64_01805 [Bdellovibrionales bacterium]|nr:hypothetical protein [Bdellovibrionales bacterium]